MADFFSLMLTAIADFLGREPIVYLFGLLCLSILVKVFRQLLP
ncbi:hypothetical protein [uncultured Oscillibacter sp.]|nr:hypothetical protein [uncultured Oscillibacter sp.]